MKHAKHILPILLCLGLGVIIGHYAGTPLPLLCMLAVIGAFVFIDMELAVYVLLIALPFSFRYILPGRFEIQTPTEPLLGMLVAVYWVKKSIAFSQGKRASNAHTAVKETFPFLAPLCCYIFITFLSAVNTPVLFGTLKGATRATVYIMFSLVVYAVFRPRGIGLLRDRPTADDAGSVLRDRVSRYGERSLFVGGRQLRRLFIATFPTAAIAVIWTLFVLIYHIDEWQWTSAYRHAPFTNYSVYGSFTAIFFLICLSRLLFDTTPYDKVLWIGWFACFGLGLMMCFSRGVWLSVLIAVGFMLLQVGNRNKTAARASGVTRKKILFIGAAGLILLVSLNLPGVYGIVIERIATTVDISYASNRARLLRWAQAMTMFLENPVLGKGYGAFAMLYEEDVALVGTYTAQFQLGAHSEYLQVLAELGIVGFIAWLWLNLAFLRYGFRSLKRMNSPSDSFYRAIVIGLMASELSLMVHFIVNNLLNGDAIGIPFWGIYGLLPAVVQMHARQQEISLDNSANSV